MRPIETSKWTVSFLCGFGQSSNRSRLWCTLALNKTLGGKILIIFVKINCHIWCSLNNRDKSWPKCETFVVGGWLTLRGWADSCMTRLTCGCYPLNAGGLAGLRDHVDTLGLHRVARIIVFGTLSKPLLLFYSLSFFSLSSIFFCHSLLPPYSNLLRGYGVEP